MAHFIYFRVIDRDNDGFVSVVELTDFLTRLGDKMSEEEVTEMIRIVDKNDRGVLSCKGRFYSDKINCIHYDEFGNLEFCKILMNEDSQK